MPTTARPSRPATSPAGWRCWMRPQDLLSASPVRLRGPVAGPDAGPRRANGLRRDPRNPITPGSIPTFDGWALLDLETGSGAAHWQSSGDRMAVGRLLPGRCPVAVSFDSGRVWIVDTRTGRPVDAPAPVHQSGIYWLEWSPDGSRILSNAGGTLELWDATTGTVQDTVTVPGDNGGRGQFRPGTTDVTILDDAGNVYTWDTRPDHAAGVRVPHRRSRPDRGRVAHLRRRTSPASRSARPEAAAHRATGRRF